MSAPRRQDLQPGPKEVLRIIREGWDNLSATSHPLVFERVAHTLGKQSNDLSIPDVKESFMATVQSLPTGDVEPASILLWLADGFDGSRTKRKDTLPAAGRALDLTSDRAVQNYEIATLAPAIWAALQNRPLKIKTPSDHPTLKTPWAHTTVRMTLTSDEDTVFGQITTVTQTEMSDYIMVLTRGVSLCNAILSECPKVDEVQAYENDADLDKCVDLVREATVISYVDIQSGRVRSTKLTQISHPVPIGAKLGGKFHDQYGHGLRVLHVTDQLMGAPVTMRTQLSRRRQSHHLFWLSDRTMSLESISVDISQGSEWLQSTATVIPFLPDFLHPQNPSDYDPLNQYDFRPSSVVSEGHGICIVWQ